MKKELILTLFITGIAAVFIGCSDSPKKQIESKKETKSPQSAIPNSFAEVTSKLDTDGDVFVYYSTEDVITTIEKYAETAGTEALKSIETAPIEEAMIESGMNIGKAMLEQSGIKDISGIGMSSIELESGIFRNKMVIHHDSKNSNGKIWSLLGSAPHEIEILNFLPDNTALAFSHEINLNELLEWLPDLLKSAGNPMLEEQFDQAIEMANAEMDLTDLISSFDSEIGMFVTLDDSKKMQLPPPIGEIPMLEFALMIKVKDDKISSLLFNILENTTGPEIEKKTVSGIEMLVVNESVPMPIPLAPAVFRLGNYLVVASTEDSAKQIVSTQNGTKKNLSSTEEFQQLSKGLELIGNHFFFASEQIGSTMSPILKQAISAGGLPEGLLDLESDNSYNLKTLGIIRMEADGIMVENHSQNGILNSVMMQTGVIPISVGAGMLLPALSNARERAQNISNE